MSRTKRYIALALTLVLALALAACSFSVDRTPEETPQADPLRDFAATSENEQCSFAMTKPVENETNYEVGVRLENRSDAQMSFIVDAGGYNGFSLLNGDFGTFETVEPGQTRETSFTIDKGMLALCGVKQIDTMDVSVRAYLDTGENVLDGELTLRLNEPAQEPAPLALAHEAVLIDENGVRITIGNPTLDADAPYVMLCCENSTDAELALTTENFRYNGGACTDYNSFLLPAGRTGYAQIRLNTDTLEQLGLAPEELEELAFDLRLETFADGTELSRQTVTYSVQ